MGVGVGSDSVGVGSVKGVGVTVWGCVGSVKGVVCVGPLQDSDNPDLRDRGYIYWRLLSTDPAAAKEVVLADKPLISEETDRLEPNLLDGEQCSL